jgi:hypothetical protein
MPTPVALVVAAFVLVRAFSPLASAAEPAAARLPDDAKLDVFLLIGQSNMAGRGKVEAEDREPIPRVWMLDKSDAWAPAVDPLHYDKPKVAGVGLGRSFAKAVAEARPDVHVGLVPCAFGGTSIDQWAKGGKLYDEAVRRAKVAMRRGTLAGILWHQGESDSGSEEKRAAYPAKLEQLIENLRQDLDAPDVPFVLGQLGEFRERKVPGNATMNELLRAFPETHPRTACVESAGLTSVGDDTHFDAKSLREFGKRYAAAYLKLSDSAGKP